MTPVAECWLMDPKDVMKEIEERWKVIPMLVGRLYPAILSGEVQLLWTIYNQRVEDLKVQEGK